MSYLSPRLLFENLPMSIDPEDDTEPKRYERRIAVAEWRVPIHGKLYRIEFEHGTTSGKRVIWVNGAETIRREWMFKLVGEDVFSIEDIRCLIRVEPAPGFKYNYLLFVDGKPFKQFTERQARALKTWVTKVQDKDYRVVLERDTMNIFLNGHMRDEIGEFVDGGTDTHFEEDDSHFNLMARVGRKKRDGLVHSLMVNGLIVPESNLID